MAPKLRIGVVGCGKISGKYLATAKKFPVLDIVACADLIPKAAKTVAADFKIPKVLTTPQLLADPEIDIVLNLTVPKAHAEISIAALNAGKHVYTEKPLGVTRHEGEAILKAAAKNKKLVCGAPDTFLGSGQQTARQAIDSGQIGRPVGFTAFMMCPGHESWHPSPEFYYEAGGGPMLDMGPYYITALLNLLGPVKRLTGFASIAIPDRTITSKPKHGQKIKVQTPDHIVGSMEFSQGAVGTIVTSFATRFAPYDSANPITIFGTEGTLLVPDPNHFEGPVWLRKNDDKKFRKLKPIWKHKYERSVGLAEMAHAILERRTPRCSGDQLFAVLDLMLGFLDSSAEGRMFEPSMEYSRPGELWENDVLRMMNYKSG
jgi:predicted dehydrogenase